MKFANPIAFWMLLAVPVLLVLWRAAGLRAARQLRKIVAARLQNQLVGEAPGRAFRFFCILLALVAGVCAWARPQMGQVTEETRGRGRDVIIVVDVSKSMLATDLPPSRLQRAKLAAEDLVRQLPADRIGLVAFAGSAFLQAPVTADHAAVLSSMRELDPELIPLPGTNISAALNTADEAFDRTEGGQRAVVLMTDGEDLEADSIALARELSGKMRIFTVGVGSPEGAVLSVPSPRGGMEYIRDESGNVVQSKLDEERLKELASAGGGFYMRLVSGATEMRRIAVDGIGRMDEHDVLAQNRTRPLERYQWPLGVALLALAAGLLTGEGVRRRVAGVAALLGLLAWLGGGTVAQGAASTASTASSGQALYQGGDYAGAQQAFSKELEADAASAARAFNHGTAAYKNQKWTEAMESFGKALVTSDPELRAKAEYNLANTLVQQARQGRRGVDESALEQAVAHYEEALKRRADFEEAQHNRDYVRKLLLQKQQQQQQQQQKKGEKKDKQDKNKDKDKQESGQDSDKQEKGEDGEKGDEEKDSQSQGQGGQGQESKDGKGKNGEQGKEKQEGKDGKENAKDAQAPEPTPEQAGEQKERGELKDSPTVDRPEGEGNKGDKEREAQAMQKGMAKMTKEQAQALLEALRSEDRRVQVWAPGKPEPGKEQGRGNKNW